jgi:glycosyltransferase involved in cell wall biosynthesis
MARYFSGALASLLKNEGKRKQMGNAARERARNLFDSRVVNARVLEEYRRLLNRDSTPR